MRIAFLLAFIIIALSFKDLFTYANFYVNQSFITENYCINKEKPELKCAGKCFLKKIFKKNKEQEKHAPNSTNDKKTVVICEIIPEDHFDNKLIDSTSGELVRFKENKYNFAHHTEVFHPPQSA